MLVCVEYIMRMWFDVVTLVHFFSNSFRDVLRIFHIVKRYTIESYEKPYDQYYLLSVVVITILVLIKRLFSSIYCSLFKDVDWQYFKNELTEQNKTEVFNE